MSDSTPTDDEVMEAWAAHSSPDLPTVSDLVSAYDVFRRWLAAHDAKVRAEEREKSAQIARDTLYEWFKDEKWATTLADRIEKEAGL